MVSVSGLVEFRTETSSNRSNYIACCLVFYYAVAIRPALSNTIVWGYCRMRIITRLVISVYSDL